MDTNEMSMKTVRLSVLGALLLSLLLVLSCGYDLSNSEEIDNTAYINLDLSTLFEGNTSSGFGSVNKPQLNTHSGTIQCASIKDYDSGVMTFYSPDDPSLLSLSLTTRDEVYIFELAIYDNDCATAKSLEFGNIPVNILPFEMKLPSPGTYNMPLVMLVGNTVNISNALRMPTDLTEAFSASLPQVDRFKILHNPVSFSSPPLHVIGPDHENELYRRYDLELYKVGNTGAPDLLGGIYLKGYFDGESGSFYYKTKYASALITMVPPADTTYHAINPEYDVILPLDLSKENEVRAFFNPVGKIAWNNNKSNPAWTYSGPLLVGIEQLIVSNTLCSASIGSFASSYIPVEIAQYMIRKEDLSLTPYSWEHAFFETQHNTHCLFVSKTSS